MHLVEAYKPLGLISTILIFCGLIFLVRRWPQAQGKQMSFSQHSAAQIQSSIYYALLFTLVIPMLLIFFIKWFEPTFNLTRWFHLFVIASVLSQYICVLVPEVGVKRRAIHRFLAFFSAILLIPAVFFIFMSSTVSTAAKIVTGIALLIMWFIVFALVKNKANHKYLLAIQATYYASFFAAILATTYLR